MKTPPSKPLVQWVTYNTGALGRDLPTESPIGAIAASVLAAGALGKTLLSAEEAGLGIVLDTEPSLTQLDPKHEKRAKRFKYTKLNWLRGVFDPEEMTLSAADINDLASRHREAEVRGGATMLLSPAHRVKDLPTLGPGRRFQLALDREFCRLARATGATHPTPGSGLPRRVAVAIAVDARDLHDSPRALTELVRAYRELDADLFWIWVWNFEPSARQYRLVRFFARSLQRETGKPALLAGIRGLWEAAQRNQVATALQGWGRGRFTYPPFEPPQPTIFDEDEEDPGWAVHTFHPVIRGAIPLGPGGEEIAHILFQRFPCECGNHPPNQPPAGVRERHFHNRFWAETLSRAAIIGEPGRTTAELKEIVSLARALRDELEMSRLYTAWGEATRDPSDGQRIVVPPKLWRAA